MTKAPHAQEQQELINAAPEEKHDLVLLSVDQRAKMALTIENATEKHLIAAAASTLDITQVSDKNGRELAHKAAMGHRNLRLAVTNRGKEARADATAYSRAVIAEETRLISLIEPEEKRLIGLRDAWDTEEERKRLAEIEAERVRGAKSRQIIADFESLPMKHFGKSAADLFTAIAELRNQEIPEHDYRNDEEMRVKAAYVSAMQKLEEMEYAARVKEDDERRIAEQQAAEAERQRLAAEELARQRAELEAARIKAEAEAAEQRRQQEAALAAEREAMEKERAAMQAERDRLAAEQAEIARQRAEAEKAKELAPTPEPVIDTRPVITIELEQAEDTAPSAPEAPPTLRLGQISERLGFTVTAEFLLSLGFAPAATEKNSKLYHEYHFDSLCAAIIRHISDVSGKYSKR